VLQEPISCLLPVPVCLNLKNEAVQRKFSLMAFDFNDEIISQVNRVMLILQDC